MAVVIETTVGSITVDLYVEDRPITCTNFLKLCKLKYYNFCLFHTVQSNFIAQTGDPTGSGNGGESVYGFVHGEHAKYYEAEAMPKIRHSKAGLISMVNCGNNLLGSQFFFTLGDELHSLDGDHCVFGEVTEGLEILIQLNDVICDEDHHPFRDIRITHTVILEDPFDDPQNLTFPDRSPEPTTERLMNGRIAPDEEVDETKGKTAEEIEEMVQKREAQARATILEIVGDIPDADIAPPENILFVCKLNPVTTDEDLEIIFGRFGVVKSCEVIRDKSTGDSLQYAFIEFEDKKSCETAYFKMDNVLIDDRRIHVDFSQSVAKMRWRGKGKGVDYFPDNKQTEQQKKDVKDRESEKYDPKGRKYRPSRSRSPVRPNLRGQDERNQDTWEGYQDRNRSKYRVDFGRRSDRMRGSGDHRLIGERNFEDKSKWPEYHPQRNYERGRDPRDWDECNWDKRRKIDEGDRYHSQRRLPGSEWMRKSPETMKERDRRNFSRGRVRTSDQDGGGDWRRNSKERFPLEGKYSDERYGGKNEKNTKDDEEGPMFRGESSRSDERRYGKRSFKQKFPRKDVEMGRNGPDISSNDERASLGKKGRRSIDGEVSNAVDDGRSGNRESRANYHQRERFYEGSGGRGESRVEGSKDRSQGNRRPVDDTNSDDTDKYGNSQSGRRGKGDSVTKRNSNKKTSKISDRPRQSLSAGKVKKGQGSKGKKIQKRKRYSSSSSCCSDSSCSCSSSSCCSSSSSDDSDTNSNSDVSETLSSSSTSPDRKSKSKRRKNKKKVAVGTKKSKSRKGGHSKKKSSSSESSESSVEDVKEKMKHRKKKASSSSDEKAQLSSRSRREKLKRKKKRRQMRKDGSSEDSSEESSSSSDSDKKSSGAKRKKKLRKGVSVQKKEKIQKSSIKHKGKKADLVAAVKRKKKRNNSPSSDSSSGESETESSKGNRTGRNKSNDVTKGK